MANWSGLVLIVVFYAILGGLVYDATAWLFVGLAIAGGAAMMVSS